MDGIDAVLLEETDLTNQPNQSYGGRRVEQLASHHSPLDPTLRARLMACQSPEARLDDVLRVQRDFTRALVAPLLSLKQSADPRLLDAMGVHGQTIRHWPHEGITLQILDPHILAEEVGVDVVFDFRRRDLAAGGQGAPLVPPFHAAMLGSAPRPAGILNLGGFANITLVGPAAELLGFDTGPGNALMDAWIHRCRGEAYDHGGAWAAQGRPIDALLSLMQSHPDLQKAGPRSTGRDSFHLGWLLGCLHKLGITEPLGGQQQADIQATLLALTASTVVAGVRESPWPIESLYVCGGGAYNQALMHALAETMAQKGIACSPQTTEALGWLPNDVEAAAFAWLALRYQAGEAGNATSVTGARGPRRLGCLAPGPVPTH